MGLVITRKLGESVIIDEKIKVQIVKVAGKQVRLYFDCDRDVVIDREEAFEENKAKRAQRRSRRGG